MSFYAYTFNNLSRMGAEPEYADQTTLQNVAACNYRTQNFFAADCTMKAPISLATTQPGIMFNGGHSVGAGGCNINDSSNLQIGTIQTHPRCRIDLFQRPFATVPYLGRGSANAVVEAQMMQGEQLTAKKSVYPLSEKCYKKYHHTPLLPAMKERVDTPSNKIERDADPAWVRGGIPSRELTRDYSAVNATN